MISFVASFTHQATHHQHTTHPAAAYNTIREWIFFPWFSRREGRRQKKCFSVPKKCARMRGEMTNICETCARVLNVSQRQPANFDAAATVAELSLSFYTHNSGRWGDAMTMNIKITTLAINSLFAQKKRMNGARTMWIFLTQFALVIYVVVACSSWKFML